MQGSLNDATALVWWRSEGCSLKEWYLNLFPRIRCQAGFQRRWRLTLMSAASVFMFVAWLAEWNNTFDGIWQPCTQTVLETNFSDGDSLIQAWCAENLFWYYFRKPQWARAYLLIPLQMLLYYSMKLSKCSIMEAKPCWHGWALTQV